MSIEHGHCPKCWKRRPVLAFRTARRRTVYVCRECRKRFFGWTKVSPRRRARFPLMLRKAS